MNGGDKSGGKVVLVARSWTSMRGLTGDLKPCLLKDLLRLGLRNSV
jgi:hypothetical protein